MKNKDFLNALGEIDKEFIEDAEQNVKKAAFSWSKIGVIAASVAVLASVLALTFALNQNNGNPPIVTTPNGTTVQSSVQSGETTETTTIFHETSVDPNRWNGQTTFYDFEGLKAYEKSLGENGSGDYYIIPAASESFELWYILRQELTDDYRLNYIDVKYKLKGVEVNPDEVYELRMNTISLRYELTGATEENVKYLVGLGYEKIEHNGKNMYVKAQSGVDNDATFAYHVVFIENGYRVGIHLPAIDTLDNLLKYTEIQKVEIK